jgi:hypothetical protein
MNEAEGNAVQVLSEQIRGINSQLSQTNVLITEVVRAIHGNGSTPGLKTEVALLKEARRQDDKRWRWLFGILGGVVTTTGGAMIIGLMNFSATGGGQ